MRLVRKAGRGQVDVILHVNLLELLLFWSKTAEENLLRPSVELQ